MHSRRPEQWHGCALSILDDDAWRPEVLCPFAVRTSGAHGETLLVDIVHDVPYRSSLGEKVHARVVCAPLSSALRRLGTSFLCVSRGLRLLLTGALGLRLPILSAAATADQRCERSICCRHCASNSLCIELIYPATGLHAVRKRPETDYIAVVRALHF